MALPVVPLSPGKAHGTAALETDLLAPRAAGAGPLVLVVPVELWESRRFPATPHVGLVVEGEGAQPHASASVPAIGGLPPDFLKTGESVDLDGDVGTLSIAGVSETPVVTAFLQRPDGKVLLLRRSGKVRTFRGRWAAVSGYLEAPTPFAQAITELREETGLREEDARLVSEGRPVLARDSSTAFVVHPLLFQVANPQLRLDWEHTEAEWVAPSEIGRRDTVPQLSAAWASVERARSNGKANGP